MRRTPGREEAVRPVDYGRPLSMSKGSARQLGLSGPLTRKTGLARETLNSARTADLAVPAPISHILPWLDGLAAQRQWAKPAPLECVDKIEFAVLEGLGEANL